MNHSQLRQRAEAMIEELIEMLDQIDGDPDFEANGDLEPSLGLGMLFDETGRWHWSGEDREGHDAGDEPDMDFCAQTMNPSPIRTKRITRRAA
ncbi:hypothetical protein VW29_02485 [Devosia limi DSM 17137]|uniref:Uncharacterized protein n=1 Tax=Devosia limi DSM 17137 TaxID=1121477 RepID=A0A0F5LXR1_9HYPH|nr:hypothetical protein [Devosia limi]KKB86447.1 hypothetical protein VW29_02485 [Devosia limi DSM 17137]SHE88723.1 hypothetical protein SAMN02745223_01325 [Devosia limi DSM 17137]